jgi:adenine-specific DNA-methyltransferase
MTVLDAEARRQAIQERLDAARSAAERNHLGQFATPPQLALDIARYALERWQDRSDAASFLDPAIGSGSFYSALRQVFPVQAIADACGVEIDPRFVDAARELWGGSGLRVISGDFTTIAPDRPYNLILTNPPYVRHHHLDRDDKERMKAMVADRFRLDISGLAGLYAHFLLLCDAWMAPGGLAVWLIPSEFMDVNYGSAVKSYLTENVTLLHIHRYGPSDVQFCDALVTSAIVVFEKVPPPPDHQVRLSFGGPINGPAASVSVALSALRPARKWTGLAKGTASDAESSHALGDFFAIKRGMATGANAFFILERQEALRKGIPAEFLRPILPSSRHLPSAVIETEPDGYPRLGQSLAIIDCDLPEPVIQQRYPEFWQYLESGKTRGVDSGYLASRRTPWYSQERRDPAPFLCTYMGRQKGDGNPFRFFWNKSRATAANVYLLLYPKGELKTALAARPDLYPIVFAQLQSLTGEHLIKEGRVYGGGLHKLEPNELANLPAEALTGIIQTRPALEQNDLAT